MRATYAMVANVSLTVRRLFLSMQFSDHGHISRTEQDRLIVTNENYWEVTSLILLCCSTSCQTIVVNQADCYLTTIVFNCVDDAKAMQEAGQACFFNAIFLFYITYIVSSGTLNSTILYYTILYYLASPSHPVPNTF